jgi:4-amino-4-deoxy-L-arabinose transferase-like glycosyltransferase
MRQFLRDYNGLLRLLLFFFILAGLHSLIVPITQGEDELAHYRYISFIERTGRLPADYAEREEAWYRADWPPLYHLLVGWAVSPLDTTRPHLKDVGESPRRRLVGEIFYPRLILYTEDANWPWQDGILAWHIGRFISILFAGGALVFTYLTALSLPPRPVGEGGREGEGSPHFALFTTFLLAFTPRYLFTSAMLGDDSLLILLSAMFIWLLLRALRGDDRWQLYAGMGLLLGLSLATKYSTGLLPLAIVPVALWRAARRWTWAAGRVAVAWGFTLAGASWWFGWIGYYFNTVREEGLLFGLLHPLLASGPDVSMRRIFAFFAGGPFTGQERPDAIAPGTFSDWAIYLFQSFWGVPVLEQDPLFPWTYLLLLLFCLTAAAGLWQVWRTAQPVERVTIGVLVLIVALLLPFPVLRFFLTHNVLETGQGRHILYPAAQAVPILLLWGWRRFIQNFGGTAPKPSALATALVIAPFVILPAWSLFQLAYMVAVYPAPLPVRTTTFDPTSIPHPLEHRFGPDVELLGYEATTTTQEGLLHLTLFWHALNQVEENYRVQVELVDPNKGETTFLLWVSHPVNGLYPTRAWDKGDVVRDALTLPIFTIGSDGSSMTPPFRPRVSLLREAENVPLAGEPLEIQENPHPGPLPGGEGTGIRLPSPFGRGGGGEGLQGAKDEGFWWLDYHTPLRPRQTLFLGCTAACPAEGVALGTGDLAFEPVARGGGNLIFIVGLDWPSGDYHLLRKGQESVPLFTVANEPRLFALPPLPVGYAPVEANFADQVLLHGYHLPQRRVASGGGLPVTLYWQSLAPVLGDYVIFNVLLDEHQEVYGGYDRLPREYYSTILWAEGEVVEDGFAVPIKPDAPPGIYRLHVGLYSLKTGVPVSLPLFQGGQPTAATSVDLGPVKVGGPPPDAVTTNPTPQVALNHPFGEQLTLLGYDLESQTQTPTPTLTLTLYWRVEAPLAADYTTFLHLRGVDGQNVAQMDRPPANGRYPTSLWDAGEIVVDEITLPLEGVAPGAYTPVVGLYDPGSGARLPVEGNPHNELPLEEVTLP